jgi:hypothetical protein
MLRGANNKAGRHGTCTLTSGIVHASDFESGVGDFRGNVTMRPCQSDRQVS